MAAFVAVTTLTAAASAAPYAMPKAMFPAVPEVHLNAAEIRTARCGVQKFDGKFPIGFPAPGVHSIFCVVASVMLPRSAIGGGRKRSTHSGVKAIGHSSQVAP